MPSRRQNIGECYLSDRFVTRSTVHDQNTRNKDYVFNIPAYRSASSQLSFPYRAIKLWNSLARAITKRDSLRTFKKELKEFSCKSFLVS